MKKKLTDLVGVKITEKHHYEEWRLRLALIKESSKYRNFWDNHGGDKAWQIFKYLEAQHCSRHFLLLRKKDTEDTSPPAGWFRNGLTYDEFPQEYKDFKNQQIIFNNGLDQFGIETLPFAWISWEEWLRRLDPYHIDDTTIVWFRYPVPSIKQVFGSPLPDMPQEHRASEIFPAEKYRNDLKPSERLLRVDLSRKRSELEREFKLFLDLAEARRADKKVPEDWKQNYETWEPDNSRFRSEAWQALEVYRLRRKRMQYKDIARTLKMGLQASKMAYKRASILIEGKPPVSREKFKREKLPFTTADVKGGCANCPLRDTCKELCPDMLAFVRQDYGGGNETYIPEPDLFEIKLKTHRRSYIKPT